MLTMLLAIDRRTSHGRCFKRYKNTELRNNEVCDESLKNALGSMNGIRVSKIQINSNTIFLKTLEAANMQFFEPILDQCSLK